jgi:hypothetical protein
MQCEPSSQTVAAPWPSNAYLEADWWIASPPPSVDTLLGGNTVKRGATTCGLVKQFPKNGLARRIKIHDYSLPQESVASLSG